MFPAEIGFGPYQIEDMSVVLPLLLGLIVLVFILWKYNIPFISRQHHADALRERATKIETNKNQVEQALAEVSKLRSEYAARLERIEHEARERIEAAVREAEAARAEIIAEAHHSVLALQRRTEEELARERTRQRILLRQQLVQSTLDAAEHSIRLNSGEDMQHVLIRDFIGKAAVGANSSSSSVSGGAV